MAYTKTITDCEEYFHPNNHLNSYDWRSYDEDAKNAAFNQALRELQVSLNKAFQDPVSDTDRYRDDYAHFEQALYILMNTPRQEEDGIDNVIDEADEDKDDKNPIRQGVLISPQAQRYLRINRIHMPRG
jgi:hypothetical protein